MSQEKYPICQEKGLTIQYLNDKFSKKDNGFFPNRCPGKGTQATLDDDIEVVGMLLHGLIPLKRRLDRSHGYYFRQGQATYDYQACMYGKEEN